MPVPRVPTADAVDAKILLNVLAKIKEGDFTARMPLDWTGVAGKVADGLNDVIIANQALGTELARVSRVVGKQGELSQRVVLGGASQSWSGSVESVNSLIDDLVRPTLEMQRVIGAVADGDLSKKVSADARLRRPSGPSGRRGQGHVPAPETDPTTDRAGRAEPRAHRHGPARSTHRTRQPQGSR